jgi:arylsulfatase
MTGRGNPRRPNIVLLNLDSARKDMFGCYGNSLGLTPNLDRLAKEGLVLENHYAPGSGSAQAHVSIFTGQHSARHRMVHNLCEVRSDLKAMPALLQHLGYKTYGHTKASFIPPANHEDQFGFDEMLYPGKQGARQGVISRQGLLEWLRKFPPLLNVLKKTYTKIMGPERQIQVSARFFDGRESIDYLLQKLRTAKPDRPVFAYTTLLHPHTPYYPPRRFLNQVLKGERLHPLSFKIQLDVHAYINGNFGPADEAIESVKKCYQAELLYADHLVGSFVESLRREGLLDSTLLIVTSDHGELLGEHGELNHGGTAWEELFATPCIIVYRGKIGPRSTINSLTSGLDLVPTIFDLLGEREWLERQTVLDGQSVFVQDGNPRDRYLVVDSPPLVLPDRLKQYPNVLYKGSVFQRVVRTLRYKYIWQSNGEHCLFRVGEPELPENNRYATDLEIVKDLHQKMLAFYMAIDPNFKIDEYPIVLGRTAGAYLTNPLIRQELKRLGYL